MSSNPYEAAVSIELNPSYRLLALLSLFPIAAIGAIGSVDLDWAGKAVLIVVTLYYVERQLRNYGLSQLLGGSAPLIQALRWQTQGWVIEYSDGRQLPVTLLFPLWRWRCGVFLRFQVRAQARRVNLMVTPWQTDAASFRLLYSRLAWVKDAPVGLEDNSGG